MLKYGILLECFFKKPEDHMTCENANFDEYVMRY